MAQNAVMVNLEIDGCVVLAPQGATILQACDLAGVYVPRLCAVPGSACCCCATAGSTASGLEGAECGLCVVKLGDGVKVLACKTRVEEGLAVSTTGEDLETVRRQKLAAILVDHPHACLTCPDRDGCSRDECTYGVPLEARCCEELGRCELARLAEYLEPWEFLLSPGSSVSSSRGPVPRQPVQEGPISRDASLCVGCGRCVAICSTREGAGDALVLVGRAGARPVAQPRRGTLRASGCTFCGQCVMVCPTGALRAPGEKGERWLAERRKTHALPEPVLPPVGRRPVCPEELHRVPSKPGVFQLFDGNGRTLRIGGTADLQVGLSEALKEQACREARWFVWEPDPLYTQRESELLARHAQSHGCLPPGNDLGDDLFDEQDL